MPFTLFCHLNTPEDAFEFFKERNAIIEEDAESWSATYIFPGKLLQKKKTITFNYSQEYCSSPNWLNQISGMSNFVSNFKMDDIVRAKVLALVSQFKFAVGIECEPEIKDQNDPRFEVMHILAEVLGGIYFTPGALLDSSFRAFADIDGDTAEDAVIPEVLADTIDASDDTSDQNNYLDDDLEPPSGERVAKRMYVALSLVARGLIDMNLSQGNQPSYSLAELRAWLNSLGIEDEMEPHEKEIIATDQLKLPVQDSINCVWSIESLVVLAWSLGLTTLPSYEQLVEVDDLLKNLSFLNVEACKENISNASLKKAEELEKYQEEIFAYNWRMVDYRINNKPLDYANVEIGLKKFDLSWANVIDGDLAFQGKRIDKVDGDIINTMCSLAQERHKASNWLQGYASLYSNVQTDT